MWISYYVHDDWWLAFGVLGCIGEQERKEDLLGMLSAPRDYLLGDFFQKVIWIASFQIIYFVINPFSNKLS